MGAKPKSSDHQQVGLGDQLEEPGAVVEGAVTAELVGETREAEAVHAAIGTTGGVRKRAGDAAATALCADNGYRGAPALLTIELHDYIPHVQGRGEEARTLREHPGRRARRWVVEVAHSWFNRFRKLLVRHEKRADSFLALNYLPAAIIAFRKVPITPNIIYG